MAADFPRTVGLLRSTPATTAMLSILKPGCSIRSHRGQNKAVLRWHLGIEVPPPGVREGGGGEEEEEETLELRVSDNQGRTQRFTWANGSDLLFDDTFEHEVVNRRTSGRRVVLFVDVPREDCGVALNLLLRLVVRAVGYSPRAQHIFSEVNLWPKTIRSKLKEFSARRGDGQAP